MATPERDSKRRVRPKMPKRRRPNADWTNSEFANGKRLIAWIRTYAEREGINLAMFRGVEDGPKRNIGRVPEPGTEKGLFGPRMQRWQKKNPTFYEVDYSLTQLGVHVSELPDEVWL